MRRPQLLAALLFAALLLPSLAGAGMPPKVERALRDAYPAAEHHHGLDSAAEPIDLSKLRGFVVIEQGGIPAERARYFISWEDYDYRGATVHLDKGDEITTRRGAPYTYLQRGTVMAVADQSDFNTTVYLKLISPEVYVPEDRALDKHHSRVTVMLGFKLPKEMLKADDDQAVAAKLGEWARPFKSLDDAKAYAERLRTGVAKEGDDAAKADQVGKSEKSKKSGKAEKARAASDDAAKAPAAAPAGTSAMERDDSERIQTLEERIEKTRRDLEQSEKELNAIKKTK